METATPGTTPKTTTGSLIDLADVKTLPAVDAIEQGLMGIKDGTVLERSCPFCGKPLKRLAVKLGTFATVLSSDYEECECGNDANKVFAEERERAEQERQEAEKAERLRKRVERAFRMSEMPARWKRYSFDNFTLDGLSAESRHTAIRCQNYAKWLETAFKSRNLTYAPNGLYIQGPCGTGKTHLAAAVLNYIIANCVNPVLAATMQELTAKLKQTYDTGEDEERIIRTYTEVPLLLIDDLGSEQPTEWSVDRIFRIINGRYNANLPTIVTSNYDLKALAVRLTPKRYSDGGNYIDGQKTADRLAEMCVICPLDGESKRGNRQQNA